MLNKQLRHKAFSKRIQSDLPRSLNVECCLYALQSFLLKFKRPIIMTRIDDDMFAVFLAVGL